MHVSVTVREPPLLEKLALGCSLQQGHSNTAPFYCWFACDITAATLVVKNKSISLGTKLYFHLTSSRKRSTVLTPNMAKWLHSCKPRIPSKKEFYFSTKKNDKMSFFHFKVPSLWIGDNSGSCHLIKVNERTLLLDDRRNWNIIMFHNGNLYEIRSKSW